MQTVVIHYHIFKNAGSSLDRSLQEAFGEAWTTFEGRHAHDAQTSQQLAAFLREHPNIRAVSSHLARPPLPWSGCIPIVLMRHPLLRARSVYDFVRSDRTQPFYNVMKDQSFADFSCWALRAEEGSVVVRNYQVIHLSDASFRDGHILKAAACRSDLEQAMGLIEEWGFSGIVEMFDASLDAFNTELGVKLPGTTLRRHWDNRSSQDMGLDIASQLEGMKEELGSVLFDALLEINALDLELYEFAKKLLIARTSVDTANPTAG